MNWKKRLLAESRLYLVLDKKVCGNRAMLNIAIKAKESGVDLIQLRDKESNKETVLKEAYALRKSLTKGKTIFIINDYIDIARLVDSDGIHLGQDDLPIKTARLLLGNDKIIGKSCHSLNQAVAAQSSGADYVSIGPIFPTPTKPEYKAVGISLIMKVKKAIKIPFFVIGGINKSNISGILTLGADRVAVSRAICKSKNIPYTVKRFSKVLH